MAAQNVLLITVDSLRFDRALDHDHDADPAPTLSDLAHTGHSFTEAYANGPNTPSSFPTILTGTHPGMYGGYRYLDERRPFLSKTLLDAGYTTVGHHSNPHLGPEKNYNHGFDTFNDGAESDTDALTVKNVVDNLVPSSSRLYTLLRRIWHYATMTTDVAAYAPADDITGRASSWIEEEWDGERPFFMWLHYMDVHYPFTPPDRFVEELGVDPPSRRRVADLNGKMQEDPEALTEADRRDLLDLYDAEIRFMDHQLGILLDLLSDRDLREQTTVVVTADHGEAFGEHDRYGHHPYLFDELLHVPLVFDVPDIDGRTIDEQVSLLDVPPTVLDLCDVAVPEAMQGRSLRPLLEGSDRETEPILCTSRGGDILATRTPDWKCIWDREEHEIRLFDLNDDPGETSDESDNYPDVVDRFLDVMRDHLEEAEATETELPEMEESEEVKRRLEDLGYVD